MSICKFCEQEKALIASHIIPNVLYQLEKYGVVVDIDVKNTRIKKDPKDQNGHKEPLMCRECDTVMGYYDGYVNKILNIEVPKLKHTKYLLGTPCRSLTADKYDIDRLHRFFISLLWRLSVCSKPIPLGKYQDIALQILKNEITDDYNLFVPLIYRRVTGGHVDNMTGIFRTKYIGKHAYIFRLPGYEVMILVNTQHNSDPASMAINQKQFTKEEVLIIDIDYNTPLDYYLVTNLFKCRDNTPGLKRPEGYVPQKPPMFPRPLTLRNWGKYMFRDNGAVLADEAGLPGAANYKNPAESRDFC